MEQFFLGELSQLLTELDKIAKDFMFNQMYYYYYYLHIVCHHTVGKTSITHFQCICIFMANTIEVINPTGYCFKQYIVHHTDIA